MAELHTHIPQGAEVLTGAELRIGRTVWAGDFRVGVVGRSVTRGSEDREALPEVILALQVERKHRLVPVVGARLDAATGGDLALVPMLGRARAGERNVGEVPGGAA